MPPLDLLATLLTAIGTLGLRELGEAAMRTWRARYTAAHATQVQADATALTREGRDGDRITLLEQRLTIVTTDLAAEQAARARLEERIARLEGDLLEKDRENEAWRGAVGEEAEPIRRRIMARVATFLFTTAPEPAKE